VTLRFGTDGVRGVANADLTPELVVALGRAAARVLEADTFVIGRDTRVSGPLLEAALAAGLAAEGVRVEIAGVVPTPAVAWVSATQKVAGAMISASHNPFPDNGIKLFSPGGRKLSDETEERLEAELDRLVHGSVGPPEPTGAAVGRIEAHPELAVAYGSTVAGTLGGRRLEGLHVVLDCANGAASSVASGVLASLGARTHVIHAEPDGCNINEGCGSTHPGDLQAAVTSLGADAGLAFDGDADRVLAVDAEGRLVDGDQVIAILALDRHRRDALVQDTVVVTVMTNLGFRIAMAEHGISVCETAVGDRYVLEAMEAGGFQLGGEQSGHVIQADLATTGDGLLTGVAVLDVMARTGRTLADLASVMIRLPQVLVNVALPRRGIDVATLIRSDVEAAQAELGDRGRVLVRPSGTEPVVRVMVEAPTAEQAASVADRLVLAARRAAGPPTPSP
jgi:phosphoglucosamine mutase